jgi:hypothetical protein
MSHDKVEYEALMGRRASVVHIVLMFVSIVILVLVNWLQPMTRTNTSASPTLGDYRTIYAGDPANPPVCKCSSVSVPVSKVASSRIEMHPVSRRRLRASFAFLWRPTRRRGVASA